MTRAVRATLLVTLLSCGGQGDDSSTPDLDARGFSEGIVELDGVAHHYLDWGGQGELLLLVPGLGGTAYLWNGIAPHFTDRFRVVALTPREHGASDKPGAPYSIEILAADLEAAVSHFSDGPAIVVGHSFAGATMIKLARRAPSKVAGLVFLDALYDFSANPDPPPDLPGGTPPSVFPTYAAAVQTYLEMFPTLMPDLLEPYVRSQLRETQDGQLTWALTPEAQDSLAAQHVAFSLAELDGISVPVLVVRAQQAGVLEAGLSARGFAPDSVAIARRMAEGWDDVWKASAADQVVTFIPGARVVVLDSVSHLVPVERPDLVVEVLDDFLGSTIFTGN